MAKPQYESTLGRAALALFAGAAVAAGLNMLAVIVSIRLQRPGSHGWDFAHFPAVLTYGPLVYCFFFFAFAVGLILAGIPAWLWLHRIGRRRWLEAALLGMTLTFAASLASMICSAFMNSRNGVLTESGDVSLLHPWLTFHDLSSMTLRSILISISGCVAGLVVWRVAYRKRAN